MKITVVLFFVLLLVGCRSKADQEEVVRPVFYHEVEKAKLVTKRTFPGIIQAAEEAKLSFKVGGNVERVYVKMGDTVPKDACLLRLEAEDYRLQHAKALAALNNAETQLKKARSEYDRGESLYIKNIISLSDYEKVKTQMESAEQLQGSALAQLKLLQRQLDYTCLKAPFSGVVHALSVHENELIGSGKPVLVLSSLNKLEVQTGVPETVVAHLRIGMEVEVVPTAPGGTSLKGHILELGSMVQSGSNYPVVIGLSDSELALYSGMTASVSFLIDASDQRSEGVLLIPGDALLHDHSGDFVYVATPLEDEMYVAERRAIISGPLKPEGLEVRKGLLPGDKVITAGLQFMYEGRKVRLLKEGAY